MHKRTSVALLLSITSICLLASNIFAQQKTSQIYAQEKRVIELYNKVIKADEQIEDNIDQIVFLLKQSQDSTSSKRRVQFNKEKTIDALAASATEYAQKRNMKVADLEAGTGYLSTEDLATDVTQLDEKIDKRVDQILELTASFTQSEGFSEYENTYKKSGQKYIQSTRTNPDYQQNKKTVQRSDHKTRKVVDELKTSIDALEKQNIELNDRIKRATTASQRSAMQDEMVRNNQTIATRRDQLAALATGENAHPGQHKLTKKEAHTQELEIRDLAAKIRNDYNTLSQLDAEYDRQRATLNALYKTHGITEP